MLKILKLNKKQVASLYDSGMTQKQIAQEFNTSVTTIADFMSKNGIRTRYNNNHLPKNPSLIKAKEAIVEFTPIQSIEIEKKQTITSNDRNLYIPEKWNWRDYGQC